MSEAQSSRSISSSTISLKDSITKDILNILLRFLSLTQLSWETFQSIWIEMKYSYLHGCCPKYVESHDFDQLMYSVILSLFGNYSPISKPDCQENAGNQFDAKIPRRLQEFIDVNIWNIGVIYCLYCLYQSHPMRTTSQGNIKQPIRIDDTLLLELNNWLETSRDYSLLRQIASDGDIDVEVVEVIDCMITSEKLLRKLFSSGAFVRCSYAGPKTLLNAAKVTASATLTRRVVLSSSQCRIDSISSSAKPVFISSPLELSFMTMWLNNIEYLRSMLNTEGKTVLETIRVARCRWKQAVSTHGIVEEVVLNQPPLVSYRRGLLAIGTERSTLCNALNIQGELIPTMPLCERLIIQEQKRQAKLGTVAIVNEVEPAEITINLSDIFTMTGDDNSGSISSNYLQTGPDLYSMVEDMTLQTQPPGHKTQVIQKRMCQGPSSIIGSSTRNIAETVNLSEEGTGSKSSTQRERKIVQRASSIAGNARLDTSGNNSLRNRDEGIQSSARPMRRRITPIEQSPTVPNNDLSGSTLHSRRSTPREGNMENSMIDDILNQLEETSSLVLGNLDLNSFDTSFWQSHFKMQAITNRSTQLKKIGNARATTESTPRNPVNAERVERNESSKASTKRRRAQSATLNSDVLKALDSIEYLCSL